MAQPKQWSIFLNSVFFVVGFSLVFSLVGVLLQSILANSAYTIQRWLSYIGGVLIILFGLSLMGLLRIGPLVCDYKLRPKKYFQYSYLTSFLFGAAFAVGWTPCVGAVLGTILTLAVTNPQSAFWLFMAYTLGLGIPFLAVGLFTTLAGRLIEKIGHKLSIANTVFGIFLVILGILVFTSQLSRIANIPLLTDILTKVSGESVGFSGKLGFGIAFIAGLVSFLSPCVLPLIPGFLSYLASTAVTTTVQDTKVQPKVQPAKKEGDV